MHKRLKQWLAARKLQKIVKRQKQRNAQYEQRRQSALKGWNTRRAG